MNKKSKLKTIYSFFAAIIAMIILGASFAWADAPMIRFKVGTSSLAVNGGPTVVNASLAPMVTLQPSVLWAVPTFSSRLGVHYLQELGGSFGLTPITGIGLSGYYYMSGISTSYSMSEDGLVITKSVPGVFLYAGLTPVNFNLNRSEPKLRFSALVYEVAAGIGYDYPLTQNLVISAEYVVRNGVSSGAEDNVSYKGSTIYISFGTTYF